MIEYKIGDIIRVTRSWDDNVAIVGLVGKIINERNDSGDRKYFTIEFNKVFPGGHAGWDQRGKKGRCWNMPSSCFRLATKTKAQVFGIVKFLEKIHNESSFGEKKCK